MKYDIEKVIKEIENSEKSLNRICKELNYPYKYIHRMLKYNINYNIPIRKYKLNLSKEYILKLYELHLNGSTIDEISIKFKHDYTTIIKYFRKYNLKNFIFKKSNMINHRFFENIDSEIKAYLLGFFLGDGTINKNNSISILIQSDDIEILDLYVKNIKPNASYYLYKAKKKSHKDRLKITLNSSLIKNSLISKGIPENKTENMFSSPNEYCNKELFRHLIRGFFDADGTVGKYYRTRRLKLTSTNLEFLNFCKKEFEEIGAINFRIEKLTNNKALNLVISNTTSLNLIYSYFYENSNYFLNRKKDKFKNVALLIGDNKVINS